MSAANAFLLAVVAMLGLPEAVPSGKPGPFREVSDQGYRVRLDLSGQILELRIPEEYGPGPDSAEVPILPKLQDAGADGFVSASMLAQKAKQFDDGLYAAVELAAQNGRGKFAGKARLLEAVAERLRRQSTAPQGNAIVMFYAGALLGKLPMEVPELYRARAEHMRTAFLSDAVRAKPISFYTWSEPLRAIFQQDRLLQSELRGRASIEALARALHDDAPARATYDAYLKLISRLTNPLAVPSLQPLLAQLDQGTPSVPDRGLALFPPSRAYETDLFVKLYGDRPVPEGFNLVNEMIARIQRGQLALRPSAGSGWYDYQSWALEPLVIPDRMPEAAHLRLDPEYRKQLLELFKGLLALTRETHAKQLMLPASAAPFVRPEVVIPIRPELSAEPLVSYYERRADSYRFIRGVLTDTFGADALNQIHRLTADGPVQTDLASELDLMESLFRGASGTTSLQIGLNPQPQSTREQNAASFDEWAKSLSEDADLGRDVRMMVPVFYDLNRKRTKVWVFLGWSQKHLIVSYANHPKAEIFQDEKKVETNPPRLEFGSNYYTIPYPVTAEVYVSEILDRDEFRKLCDQYKTRPAILSHLK